MVSVQLASWKDCGYAARPCLKADNGRIEHLIVLLHMPQEIMCVIYFERETIKSQWRLLRLNGIDRSPHLTADFLSCTRKLSELSPSSNFLYSDGGIRIRICSRCPTRPEIELIDIRVGKVCITVGKLPVIGSTPLCADAGNACPASYLDRDSRYTKNIKC